MNKLRKTIILLTFFSIAMGFLEAAVVIYLRELYYPKGFFFPLAVIPPQVALVEFFREAATLIMLITIGMVAGKNLTERFAFFLFCSAVWDIFYYVFLKLFLGWPESLLTWDILFLIPVPWVGPVIAPCLFSLTLIWFALVVVYFHEKDILITINGIEKLFFIGGSIILIISFTEDYFGYIAKTQQSLWTPNSQKAMFSEMANYVPLSYNWILLIISELMVLISIGLIIKRHYKK